MLSLEEAGKRLASQYPAESTSSTLARKPPKTGLASGKTPKMLSRTGVLSGHPRVTLEGTAKRPCGAPCLAQREAEATAVLVPSGASVLPSSSPSHLLASAGLRVSTLYLTADCQHPASVLGPVKWSHSHPDFAASRKMRPLCSFCVPGKGGSLRPEKADPGGSQPRPFGPPGPRRPVPRQDSYLSVMEARPAGGARRKGATAGPGEGGRLPAGGGAACAMGCAGLGAAGGCAPLRAAGGCESGAWATAAARARAGCGAAERRARGRCGAQGGTEGGSEKRSPGGRRRRPLCPGLEAPAASRFQRFGPLQSRAPGGPRR